MKIVLKIVVFLILLSLLAAAVRLIPPHLQVRSVKPDLPDLNQLLALNDIPNGPISIRYINTSSQKTAQGVLAHTVYLVEWADGKRFMIDAGMDSATAIEFGEMITSISEAENAVSHGDVTELLGPDIQQITGVGFTHLHLDHVQGIVPFCKVRSDGVTLYQTRWQEELQNFNTEDGESIIAASCLDRSVFLDEGLVTLGEYPGLALVGMGGHTPGSTLWIVPVNGTLWLLSGDISNSKADMLSNTGKGMVYSYLLVPEDTGRTETMRLWLSELNSKDTIEVIVSHDIGAVEASGMSKFEKRQPTEYALSD